MKKLILILSFIALNAFAFNCRDYMQYTFSDSKDFIIDSAYTANGGYDFIYYAPLKYYYTDNNLDSIVRCVGEKCWTFKTKVVKERTESTLKITQFLNDWKTERIIFLQNDSAVTYSYNDDEEKLGTIDDVITLVLRNDTLYENHKPTDEYDDIKKLITVPDPDNENVCNITETKTTYYGQSDTTTYQQIITNTENGFVISASNTEEKIFLVYTNLSATSILRKNRPSFISEKPKYLDLLGRPIKNKSKLGHMMQVTK